MILVRWQHRREAGSKDKIAINQTNRDAQSKQLLSYHTPIPPYPLTKEKTKINEKKREIKAQIIGAGGERRHPGGPLRKAHSPPHPPHGFSLRCTLIATGSLSSRSLRCVLECVAFVLNRCLLLFICK